MLEDGEPADPAVFATIIPRWQEGDTFLAGAELQRFRIVAIDATPAADRTRDTFDAVWVGGTRRLSRNFLPTAGSSLLTGFHEEENSAMTRVFATQHPEAGHGLTAGTRP